MIKNRQSELQPEEPVTPPEPPNEIEILPYFRGSGDNTLFYGRFRINDGPWDYWVGDYSSSIPVEDFFDQIRDTNGEFLINSTRPASFLYDEENYTLKGYPRSEGLGDPVTIYSDAVIVLTP